MIKQINRKIKVHDEQVKGRATWNCFILPDCGIPYCASLWRSLTTVRDWSCSTVGRGPPGSSIINKKLRSFSKCYLTLRLHKIVLSHWKTFTQKRFLVYTTVVLFSFSIGIRPFRDEFMCLYWNSNQNILTFFLKYNKVFISAAPEILVILR